jgi:hypothetical protein
LASASCCAFWPPLPATIDPICGPERVSSIGATLVSYERLALADGKPAETATERSAPGRTCLLLTGVLPSNQSQPEAKASVETPRSRLVRRLARRLPPIMSRYPRIFAIRSFIRALPPASV